jgi:hypothetical protein
MNFRDRLLRDAVPLLGYICLLGGLLYAWKNEGLSFSKAALIAFFAGLAVWFFTRFADSIQIDGAPHIESHWGGLGGGVGGWRISTSLVYLTGAIAFGIILLLIIDPPKPVPDSGKKSGSKTAGKDVPPAEKPAGDPEQSEPTESDKGAVEPKSKDEKDAAPKKDSAADKKAAAASPPQAK